jgi:hypothetical protein
MAAMSKAQSTLTAKPNQGTSAKTAVARAAASPAAKKAVVLGQVAARGGKRVRVLAPAVAPQHLSMDVIELAVELLVAAR